MSYARGLLNTDAKTPIPSINPQIDMALIHHAKAFCDSLTNDSTYLSTDQLET